MKPFICAKSGGNPFLHIVGLPYDRTVSFRSGARFAPEAIRTAVDELESYDPLLHLDLEDVLFSDAGDLPLRNNESVAKTLDKIEKLLYERFSKTDRIIALGGEHLLTLPLVERAAKIHGKKKLWCIQFDAHADLRDEYLGRRLNHASVMRRIVELLGWKKIRQVGIRSGTKEEWEMMRKNKSLVASTPLAIEKLLEKIGDEPVYLSIDVDVLDPSVMPGTGTPEPGGLFFRELEALLLSLKTANIVSADIMELAPNLDPSGASAAAAAKIARYLLLIMNSR
ncbi:MAG: agmatinase [Myxococcota bacterium]